MSTRKGGRIREWIPPAVENLLRSRFGSFRFQGDYPSWEAAMRECRGYSSDNILEQVKAASLAVKEGRAVFERDSVLFDHIEYSWPVLAGLLWIAGQKKNRLHVLDFGGSLGSSYRQNRSLLGSLDNLTWSVVEQPHFVECGKRHFEDDVLKFFPDIESCLRLRRPDVVLFSSVVHYLEKPFEVLENVLGHGFDFLLFDRTPFIETPQDRLCVQKVSRRIYSASYPAWFFSHDRFLKFFQGRYQLLQEFDSLDKANIQSRYLGQLFQRSIGPQK